MSSSEKIVVRVECGPYIFFEEGTMYGMDTQLDTCRHRVVLWVLGRALRKDYGEKS